jgi:hypothetical protein
MMLHNRGLWSSLLPEFEKMLRKRKNASTPTKSKKRVSCAHEMNEIPRLQSLLFSGVRGKKWDSRKFEVASSPSNAAVSTLRRHDPISSESKWDDQVVFVALLCSKELRLVTALLPEKSYTPRPELSRNSTGLRPNGALGSWL